MMKFLGNETEIPRKYVGVPVRRKRQSTDTTDRQGGGGEKDGGIASGRTGRVRSARVGGRRAAPLVRRLRYRVVGREGIQMRVRTEHHRDPLSTSPPSSPPLATSNVTTTTPPPIRPRPRPTPPDTRNLRSNSTTVQQTMNGQRATFTAKN
ncbi:hypothetical protein ACI65C_000041 [Semiaphis heraclei]